MSISKFPASKARKEQPQSGECVGPVSMTGAAPHKRNADIVDLIFGDLSNFHLCFVVEFGRKSSGMRQKS